MIYIPSIRIGGNPCNTDCVSGACGEIPDDPCDPPPDTPLFDDETGLWLCGPYPNTYLGFLLENRTAAWNYNSPSLQLSASGNWITTFPLANHNVNVAANTSRYIVWEVLPKGINTGTSLGAQPTLLTFAGKTLLLTPQATAQYYVTECPYTTTGGPFTVDNNSTYGSPQVLANAWTLESTVKPSSGSFLIGIRPYLWGYSP
jgi:hypothetical protein